MKFEILNFDQNVLKGVLDAGFQRCTPVQEQSLPETLKGKDIISQAQTGTGKTAVFLLTILQRFVSEGVENGVLRALIMVPTRELAVQVNDDAIKLGKYLPYRSIAIYGGVGFDAQKSALKEGVDIIVATPGRMIDLFKSGFINLDKINQFVIDEADRMLDIGFFPDIKYIARYLPKEKPRQTMLFSATLSNEVRSLASDYVKSDAELIEIDPEQVTVDVIEQKIFYVSNKEKMAVLLSILKRPGTNRVIVFTNMKVTAEEVGWRLSANGLQSYVLTGDVSQPRRQLIIDKMKSGKIHILVATDVAARGLHISDITHVINYDLPNDAANYVHRIGRTARAGMTGVAYSLVCEDHVLNLPEIEKYIDHKLENEWVDEKDMVEDNGGVYKKTEKRGYAGQKTGRLLKMKNTDRKKTGSSHRNRKAPYKKATMKKDEIKHGDNSKRMSRPSTPEERLEYYKKKYGEDFIRPSDKKGEKFNPHNDKRKELKKVETLTDEKPVKKVGVIKKFFKSLGI